MNLNQITLPSHNIKESVSFYTTLGFKQIVDSEKYARFESVEGDATFSVELIKDFSEINSSVVYFEVENLQQVYNQLSQKGINFIQTPVMQDWLWEEARLEDPSGNEICIYHAGRNRKNPPWRINEF